MDDNNGFTHFELLYFNLILKLFNFMKNNKLIKKQVYMCFLSIYLSIYLYLFVCLDEKIPRSN